MPESTAESYERTKAELLKDPEVRASYHTANIYRKLGSAIANARQDQNMSVEELCRLSRVYNPVVFEVTNGGITMSGQLKDYVGMLDALGLEIVVEVRAKEISENGDVS